MNPYFTPRTPEPKTGPIDVVLRSLACAIVVLVVGVGIWMVRDAVRKDVVPEQQTEAASTAPSNTPVVVQLPDASR